MARDSFADELFKSYHRKQATHRPSVVSKYPNPMLRDEKFRQNGRGKGRKRRRGRMEGRKEGKEEEGRNGGEVSSCIA